jgi:hypothetical protein
MGALALIGLIFAIAYQVKKHVPLVTFEEPFLQASVPLSKSEHDKVTKQERAKEIPTKPTSELSITLTAFVDRLTAKQKTDLSPILDFGQKIALVSIVDHKSDSDDTQTKRVRDFARTLTDSQIIKIQDALGIKTDNKEQVDLFNKLLAV